MSELGKFEPQTLSLTVERNSHMYARDGEEKSGVEVDRGIICAYKEVFGVLKIVRH